MQGEESTCMLQMYIIKELAKCSIEYKLAHINIFSNLDQKRVENLF